MRSCALLLALLATVGCRSTKPIQTESPSGAPTSADFVALRDLAVDLELRYREDRNGFLELSSPPNAVIFTPGRAVARVNGDDVDLRHPPMKRGPSYALARQDAQSVRLAYLSSRVVDAPRIVIPARRSRGRALPASWEPPTRARAWTEIIVHHTATQRDCCASIDRMHRAKQWEHGCGYHFVIGNGSLSRNGQIEASGRWTRQIHGAHTRVTGDRTNFWNERGIGVCLVGNFQDGRPSKSQMDALVRLVRALQVRFDIPASHVKGHGHVDRTACPGDEFPWDEFKRRLR